MSPAAMRLRLGALIVGLVLTVAIFGPWVWPVAPDHLDEALVLKAPGAALPMGADHLGRNVALRVIAAARTSLTIALSGVLLAALLGSVIGILSGYLGGTVDYLVMRFVDTFNALPQLLLVILLAGLAGGGSPLLIALVIGVSTWMSTARLVRAEALSLRSRDFVLQAQSTGASVGRILAIHLLPQLGPLLLVIATQQIGGAILLETSLAYLGLGVPIEIPTWGRMIAEGSTQLRSAWWISLFPGLAVTLTVAGFSFLGDGLRDFLAGTTGPAKPRK